MLLLLPPALLSVFLLGSPSAPAPALAASNADEPRLERTAHGGRARRLAAETLIDADAIADLVLIERAAVFELELAGERHELRVELDAAGAVIGASLWWTGEAEGVHRYDLALALPALVDAGSLDAITVEDDVLELRAGEVVVPLGADLTDQLEEVWPDPDRDDEEPVGC